MGNVIKSINNRVQKRVAKYQWRKKNSHNATKMNGFFRAENVIVGKATYGTLEVIDYSPNNIKLYIGNYCSIAPNVVFVLGGEHNLYTLSTFPFRARLAENRQLEAGSKGDIKIEDDVWIGIGATIMSGVSIGQGAVIGANSLVNKNVPPYAIVGGNPARIIKYRFSEYVIRRLLEIDFEKLSEEFVNNNLDLLYHKVTDDNVDYLVSKVIEYQRS